MFGPPALSLTFFFVDFRLSGGTLFLTCSCVCFNDVNEQWIFKDLCFPTKLEIIKRITLRSSYIFISLYRYSYTRNTCMQQPLALIGIQGTIFSEHEVFRVYDFDFEIVFIFTLSIFFKKCENNESIISFNYKLHNLHNFFR